MLAHEALGETMSYTDAMNEAVSQATRRGAYGFFYQMHTNGHQIVGFYQNKNDMLGGTLVGDHGHARGCIGRIFLEDEMFGRSLEVLSHSP